LFKPILCIFQAILFLISSFSVSDSAFKRNVDKKAIQQTSITDFTFDIITAEEIKVSESEKKLCREWFDKNIRFAGSNGEKPAYNLTLGSKKLSENLEDWTFSVGEESEVGEVYKGGKTSYIDAVSKKSGIVLRIEATIYEDNATCEWTLYAVNNGKTNSPIIKNFCGADMTLKAENAELYVSHGSPSEADDFELYKSFINVFPMKFTANGGRNCSFMPFFNICGDDLGYMLSVGWTGQWFTSIAKSQKGISVKAKQESFKAYLEPGEEIRSPLIALSFYEGGNALKGFNTLRNWEMDCVYPESVEVSSSYVIANEISTKNTEELIAEVNKVKPEILENVNFFWMDAGWYKYTEAWYDGVGNWIADTERFPDTLKPVSDAITKKGKKFLLWFEPERVRENTILYNEAIKHNAWIIADGNNLLWNLGDRDACDFISDYIAEAMVTNGVSVYRQDFNFDPLDYWEKADKEFYNGRKGICENHYITNLYKYLDRLLSTVDGLLIDNCASGGRRLDLEMTRRSVPLWRSDYNCGNADSSLKDFVLEATQAMTYSLSFWQPYSGANRYFHSEYASRSAILTYQSVYEPSVEEFSKYKQISQYMTKNYYPIVYGGYDITKYLAMQFGDEAEGAAIIYKRESIESDEFLLTFNGLDENKTYKVWNFDNTNESYKFNGRELMENGIKLNISETPKVFIAMYSEV